MTKVIKLTRGYETLVDDDIYDLYGHLNWCAISKRNKIYAQKRFKNGIVYLHRLVINVPKGMVCDHINGNGLDNRRENLRVLTYSENEFNSKKRSSSISRGITFDKQNNKFRALITFKGKIIHIGRFHTLEEAQTAWKQKAMELYGMLPYEIS